LADGTGTADHQEATGLHQTRELGLMALDVGVEERRGAADQFKNIQARNLGNSRSGTLDGRLTTRASSHREFSSPSCWQCWNMGRRDIRRQMGRVITSRVLVYSSSASRSASDSSTMAFNHQLAVVPDSGSTKRTPVPAKKPRERAATSALISSIFGSSSTCAQPSASLRLGRRSVYRTSSCTNSYGCGTLAMVVRCLARRASSLSSVMIMPPPPVVITLLPLKLSVARRPNECTAD